jgi:hypothetical protein
VLTPGGRQVGDSPYVQRTYDEGEPVLPRGIRTLLGVFLIVTDFVNVQSRVRLHLFRSGPLKIRKNLLLTDYDLSRTDFYANRGILCRPLFCNLGDFGIQGLQAPFRPHRRTAKTVSYATVRPLLSINWGGVSTSNILRIAYVLTIQHFTDSVCFDHKTF